ncbi:MAG: hypothetical protein H3C29_08235 [Simplicispira suum]|uniref:DNA-primase RepB domain-containing protein n=1 Tax=Simplicispira suum TaxID=2109915 RepID=UPI001C6CF989|nr:DNA-primase RepB domain-containing protein [Simplicispira suum]MBW7833191.1 hypothetical protein [Simplicispira suum]
MANSVVADFEKNISHACERGGRDLFFETLRRQSALRFDVTAPGRDDSGRNFDFGWNTGRRFFPESLKNQSVDVDAGGLLEKDLRGQGLKQNKAGCDVYIRPTRLQARSLIVFDDVDLSALLPFSRMIIQTSVESFQAVYFLGKSISESEAGRLQSGIHCDQSEKNGRLFSDPCALSGMRWFRVPGFHNKKPSRGNFFVRLVELNQTNPAMPAALIDRFMEENSRNADVAMEEREWTFSQRNKGNDSARNFYSDADNSESGKDWREAIRLVKTGGIQCTEASVHQFFETRALQRGRRDPAGYASTSAANFLRMAHKRDAWQLFIM